MSKKKYGFTQNEAKKVAKAAAEMTGAIHPVAVRFAGFPAAALTSKDDSYTLTFDNGTTHTFMGERDFIVFLADRIKNPNPIDGKPLTADDIDAELSGASTEDISDAVEAISDRIEAASDDEASSVLVGPYNPDDVKTSNLQLAVFNLIRRMEDGVLKSPPFQRQTMLWPTDKRSQLIESLIIGIPVPSIFVEEEMDGRNWNIIDGLQRISSLRWFCLDGGVLTGMEFLPSLNGATWDTLPREYRRSLEAANIGVHVIQRGCPKIVKYVLFRRINTGGIALSPQEVRNAVFDGPAIDVLRECATSEEFLRATDGALNPRRGDDLDAVLRFFAMGSNKEYTPPMGDFLNATLAEMTAWTEEERAKQVARFKQAMVNAHAVWGREAFRKPAGTKRGSFNKAIFDAFAPFFALDGSGIPECGEELKRLFAEHMVPRTDGTVGLFEAVSSRTGSKDCVRVRREIAGQIILEVFIG